MTFNIGINVIETDGRASPAIAGFPTSVAGLILRSQRGPTAQPVRVSNFRQFIARFGGYRSDFMGAYCVDGFFLNGGQVCYVTRVLGSNSAAASVTLEDRTGLNTLTVIAGYRGIPDPGEWGNSLYIDIQDNPEFSTNLVATLAGNQPARLSGSALNASGTNLSVNPGAPARTLILEVDNSGTPLTISFNETTLPNLTAAPVQDIADLINAQASQQAVAVVEAGGILIISRTKGTSSEIDVSGTDDDTLTRLGFNPAAATVSGTDSSNSSYTEVRVNSIAGLQVGDWVRLDDGITQNWHQITELVEQDNDTGNLQFLVRWNQPSATTEHNEYRVEDSATLSTCEFNVGVRRSTPGDPEPQTVETWEKLTLDINRPNYAPLRVNNVSSGSTYIVLNDLNEVTFNGSDVPTPGQRIRLGQTTPTTIGLARTLGTDGGPPATGDYLNALSRFDAIAIQLLSVPELMLDGVLRAVTRAAIDYCAGRGDCMFVGHTPQDQDAAGATAFGQNFRASKVYGALYWPWITVTDPVGVGSNPIKEIPPTGHVLGVYARIDQTRGVWKAPAGNEAVVRGALAVEQDITDTDHTSLVKDGSVNGIRRILGAGIVIDASRTLSTDTRWLYVNVRLLFNYVKASLREGLRWVKQEPNRETLWNTIKYGTVRPFLLRLYQSGAFGPGTVDEVFTIICGAENNPPDQIQLGLLNVEVYFYPARPAETIIITVGQQDPGSFASEQ